MNIPHRSSNPTPYIKDLGVIIDVEGGSEYILKAEERVLKRFVCFTGGEMERS